MDKRNLDLGRIIERNWTPFDRFLRNQSDKLMGVLRRGGRSGAFRKILKNRRVLRDKWKSLFWRCWEWLKLRASGIFLVIDSSLSKAFPGFVFYIYIFDPFAGKLRRDITLVRNIFFPFLVAIDSSISVVDPALNCNYNYKNLGDV